MTGPISKPEDYGNIVSARIAWDQTFNAALICAAQARNLDYMQDLIAAAVKLTELARGPRP